MIIFYAKNAEDVILSSILKHYNPDALLREYSDNTDVICIAKMHNDSHFIRVKDYKIAILSNYTYPVWIKNDSRVKFVELILAHKHTSPHELINFLAEHLFHPEELFYSSLDRTRMFKTRINEVLKELNTFKRLSRKFIKNDILYYEINPEHNIAELFTNDLRKNVTEPFIVLKGDEAIIANAEELGFKKDVVKTSRFDAFRIKRAECVKPFRKKIINPTLPTRICEF
ncbi:hypothetical protein COS64_04195 [archaeon CG06_land_8_20_14_3_00_37_11]|nr:MAG: hypothetical protein COS64_04195 [archaeon CG06_land_8_20_14_3_00_37_11]